MDAPRFDPAGYYELDVAKGTVRTRGGTRVIVMSDNVATALVSAAVRSGDLAGLRALGTQLGDEVRAALDGDPKRAEPSAVLGEAAAVLGTFGLGTFKIDRWGDALAVRLEDAAIDDIAATEALLEALLESLAGRAVACIPSADGSFLVVDPSIADVVRGWAAGGASVATMVGRLGPEVAS